MPWTNSILPISGATRISFRRGQSSESGPLQTHSGPLKSQNGPYKARAGPFKARAGPPRPEQAPLRPERAPAKPERAPLKPERAPPKLERPLQGKSGPSKARASPSKARAGPSKDRAGPSKSQSGPLQIFRRGQLTPLTPPGCATAAYRYSIHNFVWNHKFITQVLPLNYRVSKVHELFRPCPGETSRPGNSRTYT